MITPRPFRRPPHSRRGTRHLRRSPISRANLGLGHSLRHSLRQTHRMSSRRVGFRSL